MMRRLPCLIGLGLLVCLWIPGRLAAQTASIQGTVRDGSTNESLARANVVVRQPTSLTMVKGTTTDADGHYVIEGLAPGAYDVVASFVGFQGAEVAVTLA